MRLLFILFLFPLGLLAQKTAFELDSNTTSTYEELISFYKTLDSKYDKCKLMEQGTTDIGKPLHLLVISNEKVFDFASAHKTGKLVILVNNGIHPGEPEGMDASAMLARDLLAQNKLPKNLVICIIPVYNIDGMLNRGTSRVNQNGPKAYGFRGNALNYDLNRDFIKTDSRNSRSFQEIFNAWQPHLFMDTHTSNGADYQHIMTLIDTQTDKLHPLLKDFAVSHSQHLYKKMEESGYSMVPYVNSFKGTPESGIVSFLETPRYSTGYAALHHTIGYMPETHMWKPFYQRLRSTYALLKHFLDVSETHAKELKELRTKVQNAVVKQKEFPLTWKLDTTQNTNIAFLGYDSGQKESLVTGGSRLYYDHNKPFTKEIPFYNRYSASLTVKKPDAYIIPQGWTKVIELLKLNGVEMSSLDKDEKRKVEVYYLESFRTAPSPYEGHYIHSDVKLRTETQQIQYYKGDYLIPTNQKAIRYIMETLEPQAHDSFFNWNFFDSVLGQKEYYSAYIFEEEAYKMLQENPILKADFEQKKKEDEKFKSSPRSQLDWIYKQSDYYEKTHMRYPVTRWWN